MAPNIINRANMASIDPAALIQIKPASGPSPRRRTRRTAYDADRQPAETFFFSIQQFVRQRAFRTSAVYITAQFTSLSHSIPGAVRTRCFPPHRLVPCPACFIGTGTQLSQIGLLVQLYRLYLLVLRHIAIMRTYNGPIMSNRSSSWPDPIFVLPQAQQGSMQLTGRSNGAPPPPLRRLQP